MRGSQLDINPRVADLEEQVLTLERRLRVALSRTETGYRAFFDNLREAISVMEAVRDPVGELVDFLVRDVNEAAAKPHGKPPAELVGARLSELIGLERIAPILDQGRKVLAHGEPVECETEMGDRTFLSTAFRLGPDIIGVARFDISERKRSERALRDSEQRYQDTDHRYRAFFEHLSELVQVFEAVRDEHGKVVDLVHRDLNQRAMSYLNTTRELMLGTPLSRLVSPEALASVVARHQRVLDTGVPVTREVPVGDAFFLSTTFRLSANLTASASLDITTRKHAEDVLRDEDHRKSQFLAVLSHELRNPLTPIKNSLFILDRAQPDSEQARQAQQVIRRQVDQLTCLVDDLLDVTRIAHGKVHLQRQRLDLGELVRRVAEDQRSLFDQAGVGLEVMVTSVHLPMFADPNRLSQVMINLLQNSAKFTGRGGTTRITAALASHGPRAVIRVSDNGVGMSAELLTRLFRPFTQADSSLDRKKGGLGLGLSLVKGLVELHGGSVTAHSAGEGHGSEMIIDLPLAAELE